MLREKHITRVSFEHFGGKERRVIWGRKDEEYVADFCLIARRSLDPYHYRVFSYHFLLGGDWRLCCQRLRLDRGQFFHAIYRIQETLGRIFYELEPYALYPPREYFTGRIRCQETEANKGSPASSSRFAGPTTATGASGTIRPSAAPAA